MFPYLDPGHIHLLHDFHLLFHLFVQLLFEFGWLQVVHVTITVEQVTFQCLSWLRLCITGSLCILLVVSIAVVPGTVVTLQLYGKNNKSMKKTWINMLKVVRPLYFYLMILRSEFSKYWHRASQWHCDSTINQKYGVTDVDFEKIMR